MTNSNLMNTLKEVLKKKGLITRLKRKITLIKNLKYWLPEKDILQIANSFIHGNLMYGITLWATEHPILFLKVYKMREDLLRNVFGKKTFNLSQSQILKLFNWTPIEKTREFYDMTKIHKTLETQTPKRYYKFLRPR